MSSNQHKIALVAGATGDIGRAVVEKFLEDHDHVYAVGRATERLAVLKDAGDRTRVRILQGDLRDEHFLQTVISTIQRESGKLDCLVNCQGYLAPLAPIASLDEQTFDEVFSINLKSPVLLSRHALPLLRKSKGAIAFVSSISGLHANAMTGAYGAAKSALIHFARTLAQEEGVNVRVNAVCPGWVESAMMQRVLDQFHMPASAVLDRVPLKRAAQPTEVAEMLHWLCSPLAAYVSGGVFPIDGGGQP